jgi:hypothetical protein
MVVCVLVKQFQQQLLDPCPDAGWGTFGSVLACTLTHRHTFRCCCCCYFYCYCCCCPRAGKKPKGSGAQLKTKSWILKKKNQMRQKGYTSIPVDTKYTGRKRKKVI